MEKEVAGVWRTVRGRRIFIREGEDLKTAMINSGKFKELRKNYFDKDEKLRNEKEEVRKSIYEKQREINKKHYTGRDLDEDVDDKTQIKDALIKRLNDIETERELNKEKMFRNQIANEEGLSITKEQFDNLKRNGNVSKSSAKEINYITKEEYDKLPKDYKGNLSERLKYAKFRGENPDEIRKQLTDLGYDVDKDKQVLRQGKNGGTELVPVKIKDDEIGKQKYTSVMDRYNRDKEFRDRLKAEADKEAVRTQQYADEYLSRYNVSEINDDGYEAFTNFAEETGMSYDSAKRYLQDRAKNSYKGLSDKQIVAKNQKLESELPADYKEASLRKPTVSDIRKELRNMESWSEEKQYGDIVVTKTGNTGYHVRSVNDVSDPQTDYFAGVYGMKEKQVLNMLEQKGFVQKQEVKATVERFRERKGTSSSNNNGSLESLSKQALIEKLVDDQISRGVVKAENRALQIRARKNMTKSELLKYFK